jgi:hypothetical protein
VRRWVPYFRAPALVQRSVVWFQNRWLLVVWMTEVASGADLEVVEVLVVVDQDRGDRLGLGLTGPCASGQDLQASNASAVNLRGGQTLCGNF